jgi:hypothetical protein
MAFFEAEIAKAVVLALFVPPHHQQRRQLGLPGLHPRHRAMALGEVRLRIGGG